jgi:catechol 2,3-dioxygenase-like lactoylglutathione lyase family enzyme
MTPAVLEMVAATYVRDIDASRDFYGLLGFRERSSGQAATLAWSALDHGGYLLLLASSTPPLDLPRLPLLFYLYFDDVDAVIGLLREGGFEVEPMGYPEHALGGEAKVLDPDGNTVLLGQRVRPATQPAAPPEHGSADTCQVIDVDRRPCRQDADIKLADSAGHSLRACLDHADEILLTVRGAFIANQAEEGLAGYLARRRG